MGRTDLDAKSWKEVSESYSMIEMADAVYMVMALFFFALGSSVIINTTMMVIYERMHEIGTLGAMGMTGGELNRLFFLEACFLGILGSAIGVLLGMIFTLILNYTGISFGDAMDGVDFEISTIIRPALDLKSTLGVFIYSSITASIAVLLPSRKVAKIEPVEALRSL